MNADYPCQEETDTIIGCAFAVLNEIGQMLNYQKTTGLSVGLILNFKHSKLEFRRVVASTQNFIRRKQD